MANDLEQEVDRLLSGSAEDVPEPKTVPPGEWRLRIVGGKMKRRGENDNPKSPLRKALFTCQPVTPGDDVNPILLEESADWTNEQVFLEIPIFNTRDLYTLSQFVTEKLGIDAEAGSLEDLVEKQARGREFYGVVKHRDRGKDRGPAAEIVQTRAA